MNLINRGVVAILALVVPWCVAAQVLLAHQHSSTDDPAVLRQLLGNQPDYIAVQQFIFDEGSGGFGGTSKVAKLGRRLREENDHTIFIHERGKPTIKVYPQRREYVEVTNEEPPNFAIEPEELAQRDDVVLTSLGTEEVGGYSCHKIEVRYKDERLKEMRFVFFIASELKNLAIKRQAFMKPVTMTTVLSEVSLAVPVALFRVPVTYKKVIEESYEVELKERLKKLEKPVLRRRTNR